MPALDWKNKTVYKDGRIVVPITLSKNDQADGDQLLVSRLHTIVGRKTKGVLTIKEINLKADYVVLTENE